jgi:rare lipoprotein A
VIYRRSVLILIIAILSFTPLLAQQRGKATYYSKRATGARTSSGERLHHDSLTCAHRSYPFGSILKVTNPENDKEVLVRVTDRGPYARGKIIDLSWRAANELGIIAKGVATVVVELVSTPNKGVPFKDEEPLTLPELDFGIAVTSYSFINEVKQDIKNDNENQNNKLEERHQQYRKKNAKNSSTSNNQRVKSTTRQKENDSSEWSNVFERIKNFGKKIF